MKKYMVTALIVFSLVGMNAAQANRNVPFASAKDSTPAAPAAVSDDDRPLPPAVESLVTYVAANPEQSADVALVINAQTKKDAQSAFSEALGSVSSENYSVSVQGSSVSIQSQGVSHTYTAQCSPAASAKGRYSCTLSA